MLIALVEDRFDWQEKITKHLEAHGHKVVAKAATRVSALALVPKLTSLGVAVLILDGSLDQSSNDGNVVGKLCHEVAPQILRVGMSGYIDGVRECDIVVGKENLADLADTIASLMTQLEK